MIMTMTAMIMVGQRYQVLEKICRLGRLKISVGSFTLLHWLQIEFAYTPEEVRAMM